MFIIDVIDARGDKKSSERKTFDAVEDSVKELKKVRKNTSRIK